MSAFKLTALLLTLGAALASGCDRMPDDLSDCDDLECQRAWVTARWEADPAGTAAAIGRLPDTVARIALVNALAEAHPGKTADLCRLLPPGDAGRRCQQLNARPHLWQSGAAEARASADGPAQAGLEVLDPAAPLPSPWAAAPARAVPCPGDANTCQTDEALRAARQGQPDAVAGACNAIAEDRWRQECYFQAADAMTERPEPGRAADAVRLCLGASTYFSQCLVHVQWASAKLAPIAPAATAQDWAPMTGYIDAATRTLEPLDATVAARFERLLWAEALRVGYGEVEAVNGAPLDALPAELAPLVRAAAVRRLLALELTQGRDLAAWADRIDAALAVRAPTPTKRYREPEKREDLGYLWRDTLPQEAALKTDMFFGGGRRAVSDDPRADGLICLLEAAALLSPPQSSLIAEGLEHSDPLVRWTAARLLRAVDRGNPALQDAARHERDPLVVARLGGRPRPGGPR